MKLAEFLLKLTFYGVKVTFSSDRKYLYRVTLEYKGRRIIREFSYTKVDSLTLSIETILLVVIKERAEVLSDYLIGDKDLEISNDGYNIKHLLEAQED